VVRVVRKGVGQHKQDIVVLLLRAPQKDGGGVLLQLTRLCMNIQRQGFCDAPQHPGRVLAVKVPHIEQWVL
jgi:hypothetical protein